MAAQKVVIFGLDRAGKSVLTNYLVTGSVMDNTNPTLAYGIKKMMVNNLELSIWDSPGQIKLRHVWSQGLNKAKCLIYVVDVSDKERFEESKNAFTDAVKRHTDLKSPIVFVYNKKDLVSPEEIQEAHKFFNPNSIFVRKIKEVDSTIKDPATMDGVKKIVAEMVESEE